MVTSQKAWLPFDHLLLLDKYLCALCSGKIRKLMVWLPPQHGKPLSEETSVLMGDGSRRRLGGIEVGDVVISHAGRPREVKAVHVQGELECVRIETHSGRSTVAALDHPFLTTEGWVEAGKLSDHDYLANVPYPETEHDCSRTAEEFRLAGYFIGDGSTSSNNANITCADPDCVEDLRRLAKSLGFGIRKLRGYSYHFKGGVRPWLRETGLAGHTSHTKRVPEWVFRGSNEKIAHFLASYFLCDGSVNAKGTKRHDPCSEFYSVNRDLLADVQHLLLRFGVRSRIAEKKGRYKGKVHLSYRLTITSRSDMAKFLRYIPIIGYKLDRCKEWDLRDTDFPAPLLSDKVVSVEKVGLHPCRCLTVDQDETFTADDFVVHNSELISKYFPSWHIGRFPDQRIALVSYAQNMATRWGRAARDLTRSYGAAVFGVDISKSVHGAKEWELEGQRAGMVSVGIGGPLTGRPVDLAIIDDPIKDAVEAFSPATRARNKDWWESVLCTRMSDHIGKIVILQTRWHEDDLSGWLVKKDGDWVILNLPALAYDPLALPEKERLSYTGDPLGRRPGEPLCPQLKSLDFLLKRKKANEYFFAAMFQGRPTPLEGGLFRAKWFKRWVSEHLPVEYRAEDDAWCYPQVGRYFDEVISSWDFPKGKNEYGSYAVGQVWGRIGSRAYLLDQFRQRCTFKEMCDAVVELRRKWPMIGATLIELKAAGPKVKEALEGHIPGIIGIIPQGTKEVRAAAVTYRFQAGNIYLPTSTSCPWITEYEQELTAFPNGPYDDQVDATTQALEHFEGRMTESDAPLLLAPRRTDFSRFRI